MKILILSGESDFFFHALVESLNGLDCQLAHAHFPINHEELEQFNPDIILHNIKDVARLDYKDVINIGVNDLKENNCFSLSDHTSENFINPFVVLRNNSLKDERYKSDVVYIGDPRALPSTIVDIQNNDSIKYKIINNTPSSIKNYSGSCAFHNYKKFFHMAKCSIVSKNESDTTVYSSKLLDIIYSDGNPVVHKEDDQLVADIHDALAGKSFKADFISRQDIISSYTSHDRMAEILMKTGLSKMSTMVLNNKGR